MKLRRIYQGLMWLFTFMGFIFLLMMMFLAKKDLASDLIVPFGWIGVLSFVFAVFFKGVVSIWEEREEKK